MLESHILFTVEKSIRASLHPEGISKKECLCTITNF